MLQIWLDDIREAPDSTWLVFRSAEALIAFLKTNTKPIAVISFDHDLGQDNMSGYDAASWIEEQVVAGKMIAPGRLLVHSANPVGGRRLTQAFESIYRHIE